jgi:hypothetical protein
MFSEGLFLSSNIRVVVQCHVYSLSIFVYEVHFCNTVTNHIACGTAGGLSRLMVQLACCDAGQRLGYRKRYRSITDDTMVSHAIWCTRSQTFLKGNYK